MEQAGRRSCPAAARVNDCPIEVDKVVAKSIIAAPGILAPDEVDARAAIAGHGEAVIVHDDACILYQAGRSPPLLQDRWRAGRNLELGLEFGGTSVGKESRESLRRGGSCVDKSPRPRARLPYGQKVRRLAQHPLLDPDPEGLRDKNELSAVESNARPWRSDGDALERSALLGECLPLAIEARPRAVSAAERFDEARMHARYSLGSLGGEHR